MAMHLCYRFINSINKVTARKHDMGRMWWMYLLIPIAFLLLGFGSSAITQSGNDNQWYKSLPRAPWTPPSSVFSVVWAVLYVLLGVALANMLTTKSYNTAAGAASLSLLSILCVCIFVWPFVYFKAQSQVGGVALLGVVIAIAVSVCALSGASNQWLNFACLAPLVAWGGFAMSLGVYPMLQS